MINLVKAEFIKIVSKRSTKVAVIIATVLMLFSCLLDASSEINPQNWREEMRKEVDLAKSEVAEHMGTNMEEFYVAFHTETIAIGEYSLSHDIAYNVVTPLKFAYNNTFVMSVWIMLILILAVINFSDEYQFGTIKQILTRPYSRKMILCAKEIVFAIISVTVLLMQLIISYLVGMTFFGENGSGSVELYYTNGKVIEINMWTAILKTYISYVIILMFLIGLAYLLVTITRTSVLPILMTMAVWLGGGIITGLIEKYNFSKYTIFPHLDLTQYIDGNELLLKGNTMSFSFAVILVTYIVIQIAAFRIFAVRDN